MEKNFNIVILAGALLFLLMGVFIVLFMIFFRNIQKINLAQKDKMQKDFEDELLRSQMEIQEFTFNQIGRELHDNLGQALSVAKLYLSSMENESLEATRKKMGQTQEIITKAIQDLRTLSKSLNSDSLHIAGFHKALEAETNRIGESGAIQTLFKFKGTPKELGPETETILFRMCQEILTNAIRHSSASQIQVNLNWGTDKLTLSLEDNGKGFEPSMLKKSGQGLANLRKRAEMIHAHLNMESKKNIGTKFVIELIFVSIFNG